MPTSSLVLTLDDSPEPREQALGFLCNHPSFTVGTADQRFLPVVLQTETILEGVDLIESLWRLRGVEFVDVVQVDFGDAIDVAEGLVGDDGRGER